MNEKTKGVIAYLFGLIGGFIILLGMKDSAKETKVHAAQSITLCIAYFILSIAIMFVPVVKNFSWILQIGYFVLIVIGAVKAYNEQEFEIPIISEQAKKIFAKQIEE